MARNKDDTMRIASAWGSFTIVPNEILESDLSPRAVLVFVALMSRVSHSGESARCWPSYEAIKERCAVKGREAISAGLDELEAKGYLRRERRFSASTVYTLIRPSAHSSIRSESEPMESASFVRNPNDSSSESERPFVRNPNANKIQRTRNNEQDPISPARAARGGADSDLSPVSSSVNPDQPAAESRTADPAKPARKAKRTLDEHEAQRHRELFEGLVAVCVVDVKLMGGRIARTAKQLREADASATRATMDEFLAWWKTSDFRGMKGKPPTLDQVLTCWKLFRENYAERPAAQPISGKRAPMTVDRIKASLDF